ncbi:hypothetical protein [Kordia jejudonensis]|uniref:hypothetical protein n=1 Tax=Kordia jejudonensis TaxID=1348245 RepID=UPI0006292AD4|nr:hypothetical protein [Kordia jejudonensis]
MKLHIEQWIENNEFSKNVNILFKDSIICYKSGANRASLLFSYLGFLTLLKERIIGGTKPNLFPPGEWDQIISKLQNEDLWEKTVFESTQQREKIDQKTKDPIKSPIFNINENLRLQIKYWKDRRNDCAHYKDNIIDNYHIESFWAFIESNLSKITIEGGLQSLINKIYKHFDPTITPPDKDVTPLIKEIEHSVQRTELNSFWNTLLSNGEIYFDLSEKKQELISRSLEVNSDDTNESLISILKGKKTFLNNFLANYPDKVLWFNFSPEEVRTFWKTQLSNCNNILEIYISFLRNDLIPEKEILESNIIVINAIRDYSPDSNGHQLLSQNGFYETFKSEILYNRGFTKYKSYLWVNERASLISGIIKNYPPDKDVVDKLIEHYNENENSDWLLERFDSIFITGNQITNDYKDIIQASKITIPEKLKKYFA